jgi:aldose 1-epimerase
VIARRGRELAHAARAVDPGSGRTLDVWTTEPGVQFYDGNLLGGPTPPSWRGRTFPRHTGFCLETQHYPDSPNNPRFPSTVLRPGERLQSTTVWRFGAA